MPVVPTTINSEAEWAAEGAKQGARSRKSSSANSMQEPLLSSSAVILVASANSTTASEAAATEYKLYPVRWWVLFVFCLIAFGQSLIWISWSPITPQAMDYYNCSEASIDLLLNWGTICYVLFAIVCARWGRTAQGLRKMMYAAAVFEIVAVVLRLIPVFIYHERLQPYAIYFAHAAHISNALACPPISVTVTKVSCVWMGAHERVAATAVAVVSNNMGTAVGMIVAPYLVAEGHPEQVPRLLYMHAAFGALLAVCIFSYLPVRPPTHPSPAAEQMFATRPAPFGPSFRAALKNVHLVLLALCAGAVTGIFNTWSGILATAMPADAFNQTTVGWFAAGATLSAIAGGIFHALLLAWHPRLRRELKRLIITLIWMALGCGVWFSLSLASVFSDRPILGGFSTSLPSLGMAICLLGWFVGSSYPLAFELAVSRHASAHRSPSRLARACASLARLSFAHLSRVARCFCCSLRPG